jgi:hypothetical protein
MKKSLIVLFLILLIPAIGLSAQRKVFPFYDGLTGGTAGKLDAIDACNANGKGYDLQDKDIAFGIDSDNSLSHFYWFDIDSAAAESSPNIIEPDECDGGGYSGDGRWIKADPQISTSSSPNVEFQDADAAGTETADKLSCAIRSNMTTTTEDAEYGDIWIECVIDGTHTEVARFDASDDRWETTKSFKATSIDAGTAYVADPSSPVTVGGNGECRVNYLVGSTNTTFNLPAETLCQSTAGVSKVFCFTSAGTGQVILNPDNADHMNVADAGSLANGVAVENGAAATGGDAICIFGGSSAWYSQSWSGTWDSE